MAALTVSRADQERLKDLLSEVVTVLCRNGLKYTDHMTIDGLLGITVDSSDVFLVKLSENVRKSDAEPDLSRVSELLGAARGNFGVLSQLAADGFSLGSKDLNDNHPPPAINIAPISGDMAEALTTPRRVGKRTRARSNSMDTPQSKRTHVIEPQSTSGASVTKRASLSGWQVQKDDDDRLVIKTEPMDPDDEAEEQPPRRYKTLGVISAVPTDTGDYDSADDDSQDGFPEGQPEGSDGVLQTLRAALIHKLANNGTPFTKLHAINNNNVSINNNDCPSTTPASSSVSAKKRKVAAKVEKEDESVTLKCLMCTYETNRRYNFIRHMRGHSKSYAIYACDLCGDRFHSEDELGAHGLEAHKGHHLTCDQCGMTFMSERGKNIHAKTHKMMPIPEKKTVECETQCSTNDLEMSMSGINSSVCQKVMSATVDPPEDSDETPARYRTLREQLSSGNLVLRFPVLNGQVQKPTKVSTGVGGTDGEDSGSESDHPDDLSTSKSSLTSTSTSPPPPPLEEPLNLQVKSTASSSTSTEAPASTSTQSTSSTSTATTKASSATSGLSTATAAATSMKLATKPAPFPAVAIAKPEPVTAVTSPKLASFTVVTATNPSVSAATSTRPSSFTPVTAAKASSFTAITAAKPANFIAVTAAKPFTFVPALATKQASISTVTTATTTPLMMVAKEPTRSSMVISRQSPANVAVAKPASLIAKMTAAGTKQLLQTIVKPGVTITTSKPVAASKTTTAGVKPGMYTSILPRLVLPASTVTTPTLSALPTLAPVPTVVTTPKLAGTCTPIPIPAPVTRESSSPAPVAGDSKPKEKSRKQRGAQIIRLVIKPEPLDS